MKISKNKVVYIDYSLRDDDNNLIDASEKDEPLAYIHGNQNLIEGLERELEGKAVGDEVKVRITPEDGYGDYNDQMVQTVPRAQIALEGDLEAGMQFMVETPQGETLLTVTKIDLQNGDVTLDANHPLAGKHLNFEVKVVKVRNAEQEELTHGHVHGPGGHSH